MNPNDVILLVFFAIYIPVCLLLAKVMFGLGKERSLIDRWEDMENKHRQSNSWEFFEYESDTKQEKGSDNE